MHLRLCFVVLSLCSSLLMCLKFHSSVVDIKDKEEWVQEIQLNPSPVLVLFYASSCGVCHRFVKTYFNHVAKHYEAWSVWNDQALRVATVNCHMRESMKICYQEGNPAYPKMYLYNLNMSAPGHQDIHVPSYESVSVLRDTIASRVEKFWGPKDFVAAIDAPTPTPINPTPTPIDIARDARERLIAAAAVIVHTFDQVFPTMDLSYELEPERLESMKHFLSTCAMGFPGKLNRLLFQHLLSQLKPYTASKKLTLQRWHELVDEWKIYTEAQYVTLSRASKKTQQYYQVGHVVDGELAMLPVNVFNRDGSAYLANLPVTGTAPIWWLLHILTINPLETMDDGLYPDYFAHVYTTLRQYVRYFLACPICQTNFLAENDPTYVQTLLRAPDQRQALLIWLWKMHNSVSARLGLPTWLNDAVVSDNRMEEILTDFYGYMDMELDDPKDIRDDDRLNQVVPPKQTSNSSARMVVHSMVISFMINFVKLLVEDLVLC